MRSIAIAFVAGLAVAGLAVAADPVKVDLKSFKWKAAFSDGNTDLGGYDENENRFFFYTNGSATGDIELPADGEYTITIEASCTAAMKEMAKFKLSVGDTEVAKEHSLKEEGSKEYTFTAKLKKGKTKLKIDFLNDKYKDGEYDLNLFLHSIKVEAKK